MELHSIIDQKCDILIILNNVLFYEFYWLFLQNECELYFLTNNLYKFWISKILIEQFMV